MKIHHENKSLSLPSAKKLIAINNKLVDLELNYPGILESDMFDWLDIVEHGASKYALNNWLEPNGTKASHKEMHDSAFHHLAESYAGLEKDKDSGFNPKLHAICRLVMAYVRQKKGLHHERDK